MEDRKFLVVSLIGSFVLIFGAVLVLSKGGGDDGGKNVDQTILSPEGVHNKGPVDAKVTIVEFSDFECPACKIAKGEVDKILEDYKDKVRLVYRHMPFHYHSEAVAEASEYAGDGGKFWEWYDLMFDKQSEWAMVSDETKFGEMLVSYAKSLGLDDKKLMEAVIKKTYNDRIQRDIEDGGRLGINATPTFFVNGEEVSGYSFEEFERLVEKNLK